MAFIKSCFQTKWFFCTAKMNAEVMYAGWWLVEQQHGGQFFCLNLTAGQSVSLYFYSFKGWCYEPVFTWWFTLMYYYSKGCIKGLKLAPAKWQMWSRLANTEGCLPRWLVNGCKKQSWESWSWWNYRHAGSVLYSLWRVWQTHNLELQACSPV